MILFEYVKNKQRCIEVKIKRRLTYDTVASKTALQEIKELIQKSPSELIVHCNEIEQIDSCGLASLIHITKSVPNARTKLVGTTSKLQKLRALYLHSKEHL